MYESESLESKILDALYNHFQSRLGSPDMTFNELNEAIGVSQSEEWKYRHELYKLKENGWIKLTSLDDGSAGTVALKSEGIRVARDRKKTVKDSTDTPSEMYFKKPCPASLEDLIRVNQECARLIQRDELVGEIQEYLAGPSKRNLNYIVLYGQPMTGKTKILHRLSEVLDDDDYVPLIVTVQGSSLSNLDYFAFDLAFQLTIKFNDWAKHHRISAPLDVPEWKEFKKGIVERAFREHWQHLRQSAGQRQPVVMFDEIERLLDPIHESDERILDFIYNFVRNPDNGYFVLAGSERIHRAKNERFSSLIGRGRPIPVRYLEEDVTKSVFLAAQDYFTFETDALETILALCDGHPRVLQHVYEVVASMASRPDRKREIRTSDIEPIVAGVIERVEDALWALSIRLSEHERYVVKLVSCDTQSCDLDNLVDGLEYRLEDLLDQGNHSFISIPADYHLLKRGADFLEDREWLEWKNLDEELFRFKLGIVPVWLRSRPVALDEYP